jgi:phage terminase large subunit-like protein
MPTSKRKKTPQSGGSDPVTAWAEDVVAGRIVAGPHVRNAARRHLHDLLHAPGRGFTWNLEAALRAIEFFPGVLRLNGGQFEGLPFELQPTQQFIIGSLFGWKRADGTRRFRRAYIEAAKGIGKALDLNTPIPTPAGWTTMGQVEAGDVVFDERGVPCHVTATTGAMLERPCFELVFDDGARITADAEHLWFTEQRRYSGDHGAATRGVPKAEWGGWRKGLRTTAEIARTLRYPNGQYQSANHSVPLSLPLDLPEADLPIEPYTLGVWLGDGDSDCARITVADDDRELLHHLRTAGTAVGARLGGKERVGRYRIGGRDPNRCGRGHPRATETVNGHCRACERERERADRRDIEHPPLTLLTLNERLRALRLFGEKRIPAAYLRASKAQRFALLQGLMDTDGHVSPDSHCEFTTTRPSLRDGAAELLRSVGIKAFVQSGRATIKGRDVGPKWRVTFDPPHDVPVFRLSRKLSRQTKRHDRRRLAGDRRIKDCRPVASVPVKCISVDSPSRMYLAGREMVPTHNSPMAAGIGMYCLLADGEPRAEIYAAASKMDQAKVLFRDAVAMYEQSPALYARLIPSGGNDVWNLADPQTGSFFRPIASDRGQSGPRPSCALLDEVHEHRDGHMIEMLERGFKFRRQPLLVMMTNSGTDRQSVCWEEHLHAVRVAAGTMVPDDEATFVGEPIDDTAFSFVCGLDKGDEPLEDPSCWVKANPLLGVTVQEEYLAGAVAQGLAIPGKLNNILRLHFCVWTDAENAWMSRPALEACLADFDPLELAGRPCYLGLDLSATRDLTALAFVVPTGFRDVDRQDPETGLIRVVRLPTYDAWVEAWTPADTLDERARTDQAPYDVWVREGWLEATPGKLVRYDFVAGRIAEAQQEYDLKALAYDAYAFKRNFEPELDAFGAQVTLLEHPQGGKRKAAESGLWMPGSLDCLEKLILERRIRIRRSPVVIAAIMSAAIEEDAFANRWFSKRKATNRIDPIVSLAMAAGAAQAGDDTRSAYDTRGVLVI